MLKILVINGPNLNLLGRRERTIYGELTLSQINSRMENLASTINTQLEFFQSNNEGAIIDKLHEAMDVKDGVLINPAAYTHTSVAIRDAISSIELPTVEIHLSNLYSREEFRHKSLMAPVCIGQISGFGPNSYNLGLRALVEYINSQQNINIS